MDYIILNNDGSLQKSSLTRYIQQGNHGVDKIFVGWANGLQTDLAQAVFTLPNQTTNTALGTFEENYNYDGEHTINGWVFTLTNAQTIYNGLLMTSIRIIRNGIVQVAYPFALVINETGVRPEDDSGVTLEQLDSYLLNLQTLVTGAVQANTDSQLSNTSINPVQNKVVKAAIDDAIAGVYKIQGSATVQDLEDLTKAESLNGYVYNISDSGTLTNADESTVPVVAGDNICFVWNEGDWFWDNMAGFIDPSNLVTLSTNQTITGKKTIKNEIDFLSLNDSYTTNFAANDNGAFYITHRSNQLLRMDANNVYTKGLLCWGNGNYDLGNSTNNKWRDLFLGGKAYFIDTSYADTNNWQMYATNQFNLILAKNGTNRFLFQNLQFSPADYQDPKCNLGSANYAWKDFYLGGIIYHTSYNISWDNGILFKSYANSTLFYIGNNGQPWVYGDIIPAGTSGQKSLGNSTHAFKDLYLGDGIDFAGVWKVYYSSALYFSRQNSNRVGLLSSEMKLYNYDLDLGGTSKLTDGSASRTVGGLSGKTGTPTIESNTAELPYDTFSELSLSANTTLTLQTAPTGCYPEYKAIITASAAITLTFTGVSNFLTNDEDNVVITNGTNTTVALASGTTVEISIVNGKGVAINFEA